MAIRLIKKHPPKAREPPNATPVYPTKYARRTRGYQLSSEDPNHIRCYNCGWNIENKNAEADCPLCGSDNFLGKVK